METISWVVRWSAAVSSWGYLGTTVLLSGHLCSYNYVINTNKAGDNSACSSDVFPLYCLYMMTINLIFPFPVFFFLNNQCPNPGPVIQTDHMQFPAFVCTQHMLWQTAGHASLIKISVHSCYSMIERPRSPDVQKSTILLYRCKYSSFIAYWM